MFNSAPTPHDPAAPANDDAPDPSVARAERRLRLLEELAEIGMELARALRPGAIGEMPAPDKASGKVRDPADAFAPLSRAIRLTLALEAKTDEQLRDLKAGVVRDREADEARAVERAKKAREAREQRVHGLVMDVALAECESDAAYDVWEALDERLEHDEAYDDYADPPLRETVERLCKDLCLSPDWSRWDGEGWNQDGPPVRPSYSPFHTPSAKPLLDENGEPRSETPAPPPPFPAAHDLE
jgi:hypothetical protein